MPAPDSAPASPATSGSGPDSSNPPHPASPSGGTALLCIDIGNTHAHLALRHEGRFFAEHDLPTPLLDDPARGLPALLPAFLKTARELRPLAAEDAAFDIAFCSVVPAVTPRLLALAAAAALPIWQLTHRAHLGLPVTYPAPAEIGQDRLAHAIGARLLAPDRPAIVIGLGTAVTFDLVTPEGGYEGGIIAPGPALVTRYLHERTAQLPLVTDLQTPVTTVIGKSTAEAIRIGAVVGYAGLIQALLDAVLTEFAQRGLPPAEIFLAGGAAQVVEGRLRQPARVVPRLALLGLAAAHALNHSVPSNRP